MTLTQLCFSFKGRINRSLFWLYTICAAPFMLFLGALANTGDSTAPVVVPLFLLLIYMDIAVCVKRLHDTNRSGWNLLWGLIPILGWLFVGLHIGFAKGTPIANEYGPPVDKIGGPNAK